MNAAAEKKSLLIVDDEKKLLLGLKAIMTRQGFTVFTATDGNDGFQMAKEYHPDIILCDVMMPAPNGFQLKRMLSEDAQLAEIPFIFLTARTGQNDKLSGLNQGADDYITKPFDVDELIARVRTILRRDERGRQRAIKEMETTLEKVKRSIASNLAHEFRTPLGIILTSLDLAIQEKFSGNTEELDWYLQASLNSALKLSSLVQDLILLHDIDQGRLNKLRRTIDLSFRFHDPIQRTINQYAEKQLDVVIQVDPTVDIHAPEVEFSHAVTHLVDNACKFSPPGARVWVRLSANGAGGCSLEVENENSYIPVELRQKVFERYYQVQQGDSRPFGGLGLGLTVAKAVAQSCNGDVEVLDSTVGCKVRMLLPPAASASIH